MHLTPFKLHFGCKTSVSHHMPFGCKCFVLKCGNLDKFESRSSNGILLGYTPHGRSYRVFNLETNTVIKLVSRWLHMKRYKDDSAEPHCSGVKPEKAKSSDQKY
jgi:hypothetical protein